MYYVDITAEQLKILRDALSILEHLRHAGGGEPISLYLYGISTDPAVLDAAKEAIAAESDQEGFTEEDIELAEVAVEMPLSSDTLYYLLGSGVTLGREDSFVYLGEEGEGAREVGFNWAQSQPKATVAAFSKMALSEDPGWADRFLMQYGAKVPMKKVVERSTTSEIEAPPAPAQPAAPASAPAAPAPGTPKKTSVPGGTILRHLLEDFLGE